MPGPSLTRSLFRSRFGRRLLLLFLVCSLLPMTALAVLSFGTVTRQLREGSLGRLEHSSRALAAVIAQRLHFLDGDMAQVSQAGPCPAPATDRGGPACDGSLNYALIALTFVRSIVGKGRGYPATIPRAKSAWTTIPRGRNMRIRRACQVTSNR